MMVKYVALLLSSDQFDCHDDRDDDGEGESVEEHKSVIMHLLSQVRLGMDLTKVRTSWRLSRPNCSVAAFRSPALSA